MKMFRLQSDFLKNITKNFVMAQTDHHRRLQTRCLGL